VSASAPPALVPLSVVASVPGPFARQRDWLPATSPAGREWAGDDDAGPRPWDVGLDLSLRVMVPTPATVTVVFGAGLADSR
jgi:hypothetical protein